MITQPPGPTILGIDDIYVGTVLVFDGTGRHPAPLVAEKLAAQGANIVYCSIDAQIAEELTYAERFRWKKRENLPSGN